MQAAWKVGVFVVVFAAMLLGAYALLEKSVFAKRTDVYYAAFADAGGVTTGSPVLLSGVKVGQVTEVQLVSAAQARLKLAIDQGTRIPEGSSVIVPMSFISIGDTRVNIVPAKTVAFLSPGSTMPGTLGSPMQDILPDADKTLAQVNSTLVSLQNLLEDKGLKKQLNDLLATVTDTSKKFGNIAGRVDGMIAQNSSKFSSLLTTTGSALKNMEAVSIEIKRLVASGQLEGKVTALMDNLNGTVLQGKQLVADMQSFVNDPDMRANMKDTLANFKVMSDSGTKIAANAETMSANGVAISEETKTLMTKANKLADQVQDLIEKFNQTIEKFATPAKGAISSIGFEGTLSQESDPGRLRADVNVTVPVGKDKLMLGLWDAFESNKLNLQLQKQVNPKLGIRYGAYASKPGLGVDYDLASRLSLRGDLFGLNDPRLDLRLGYRFGESVSGFIGVNKVFERNSPTIGVTVRK